LLLLEVGDLAAAQEYGRRAFTVQPQNNLFWYLIALIRLARGNRKGSREALDHSYHLSSKDTMTTCIIQFWYKVLADLDGRTDQTQIIMDQVEQAHAALDESDQHKIQGLLAAYRGDAATAHRAYSTSLDDRQQLSRIHSHRLYLLLLAQLFPDRTDLQEIATWFAAELQQRMHAQ
jgi:hypothetical protein